MLQLYGNRRPAPHSAFGAFPQPPLRAGHLSATYAPRPSAVREARAAVRRHLEEWGLAEPDASQDLTDTTALLVSEVATHALLHSTGDRITLSLMAAHGVLRCEIGEIGGLGDGTGCARPTPGDRGMFLVAALARRWGCEPDGPGGTVWFELGTCVCDGCDRRQP
ncbi:ATP-binding protein [Streptomyces sp. NPDC088789]|uniref:ATP-binding protein n=1 Tax=Streptomyces sp. NPDC088789 TaxID=3365899 RepID=UPI00380DD1B4